MGRPYGTDRASTDKACASACPSRCLVVTQRAVQIELETVKKELHRAELVHSNKQRREVPHGQAARHLSPELLSSQTRERERERDRSYASAMPCPVLTYAYAPPRSVLTYSFATSCPVLACTSARHKGCLPVLARRYGTDAQMFRYQELKEMLRTAILEEAQVAS